MTLQFAAGRELKGRTCKVITAYESKKKKFQDKQEMVAKIENLIE